MKPSRFTERADHWDIAGAGGRDKDDRRVPQARYQELCRNLGDEVWLKAAYRGGCQACQNLPERSDTPC